VRLLSFLGGSRQELPEPNLPPDLLAVFRRRSPAERRRLLKEAHESAMHQVTRYGREYQGNYDAHLQLELSGAYKKMTAAVAQELRNPDWRSRWQVVVGQDDPPDGAWGWMIIQTGTWPMQTLTRVPVSFATQAAARAAGDHAAAGMWT
jgi:hypothetical protein